jgi:tetratricopeptide (TPR) repeat protein
VSRHVLALLFVAALGSVPAAQGVSDRNQRDALQHYRAGEEAMHGERLDVAEREFREAVKLDPLLHLAHYGLGQVFMRTKRYPLAVQAYLDARGAFRAGAAQALQDETAYQRQLDDQIRALEDAKRSFEGNGPRAKVPDVNATLLRIDTQINQLKNQRRRNPDRPAEVPGWISLALGSAFFRTDAMADAEREYREASKVEPKLGEAHNNLAVVLMLTGRLEEAEREMKAAEKAGFRVSPQFKEDLKKAMAGGPR